MPLESRPAGVLKLFGVRILGDAADGEDVMRKSLSTGNLASCTVAPPAEGGAGEITGGYLSDGGLVPSSSRSRARHERKRGLPWTEEEHRTFLAGLEKLGKGDWRGISRNFVTTRTPTQVASHAQKYFLRKSNPSNKKRRSSLFDVVIGDDKAPVAAPGAPAPLDVPMEKGRGGPEAADKAITKEAPHLVGSLPHRARSSSCAAPGNQELALAQAPCPPSCESIRLELSIAPPRPEGIAEMQPSGAIGVA